MNTQPTPSTPALKPFRSNDWQRILLSDRMAPEGLRIELALILGRVCSRQRVDAKLDTATADDLAGQLAHLADLHGGDAQTGEEFDNAKRRLIDADGEVDMRSHAP